MPSRLTLAKRLIRTDGIGNNLDPDDDNDGLSDDDEVRLGNDPLLSDSDRDGVLDGVDAQPTDSKRTQPLVRERTGI